MAVNVDFKAVGEQFCTYYYQLFATNRNQLTTLYGETSCMTFENDNWGCWGVFFLKKKISEKNIFRIFFTNLIHPFPSM